MNAADLGRAETLAGLRELADWLEANPEVPLPYLSFGYFPANRLDGMAAALAELFRVADAMDAVPGVPYGNHVVALGPQHRGGVRYEVIVCDAAEDFALGVGEVAGPAEGSGSATAPTESAAADFVPAADGAQPAKAGTPAAVPAPVVSGDGAAVTPDVWVPIRRRGTNYHRPGEQRSTVCGRNMFPNGVRLLVDEALTFGAVPCPRCYGTGG